MPVASCRPACKGFVDVTMTCDAAAALLDAFVDAELEPSASVEVARHAGQCPQCDDLIRDLLAVREALVAGTARAVDGLDLTGVWARVESGIARADAQVAWRARAGTRRRGVSPRIAWGAMAALAAGVALAIRFATPQPDAQVAKGPAAPTRVAARRLPNHVVIDRLAGKDIGLRREPKSGTTMIWVNHEVEGRGW